MARPIGTGHAILSVVGPHSGCGKTTFIVQLLRQIPGLGCLKVSPARDWPSEAELTATVSGEDYYLEPKPRLEDPTKDTALYLAAGAVQTERLRHRREGLAPGLQAALSQYPPDVSVIIESSSAVRHLDPVAVILIVRPPIQEMKPGSEAILPRVTHLLVNATDPKRSAATEARALRRQFPTLATCSSWLADLAGEPLPSGLVENLLGLLRPT
jgi:hypothetical protein